MKKLTMCKIVHRLAQSAALACKCKRVRFKYWGEITVATIPQSCKSYNCAQVAPCRDFGQITSRLIHSRIQHCQGFVMLWTHPKVLQNTSQLIRSLCSHRWRSHILLPPSTGQLGMDLPHTAADASSRFLIQVVRFVYLWS